MGVIANEVRETRRFRRLCVLLPAAVGGTGRMVLVEKPGKQLPNLFPSIPGRRLASREGPISGFGLQETWCTALIPECACIWQEVILHPDYSQYM